MLANFYFPDYILLGISILNLVLSIFIFTNDPKNKINISFAFFAFFISFWPLTLFLFRNSSLVYAEFWMKFSYVMASGIAISFWYFMHEFPRSIPYTFRGRTLPLILTFLVVIIILIPHSLVKNVVEQRVGMTFVRVVTVEPFGYAVFSCFFIGLFFGAAFFLRKRIKTSEGIIKKQILILFNSVVFSGIFGVIFNLLLPSPFFQNFSYIYLGPFFTFCFIGAVSYAVAKHQLMSIKALATEFFVVVLLLISLIQIFFALTLADFIYKIVFAIFVLLFGVFLIRSVVAEVRRREEVTNLAHALEKANIRLQELDRQKTEFMSIASHQLRTPLSIFKGYIELLEDGGYGKITKQTIQVLDNMNESNEHLCKLVDQFLDVSRIEQDRTKFDFKEGDMNKLTAGVVKELENRAGQKGLRINWSPDGERAAKVMYDEEKIRHVIYNFIDNAIKYTEKGVLKVALVEKDNGVSFTVVDRGIGFDKIDEANFFQKFYRGENVKGVNVGGTGLGLYVCKKFIEAHNGKIWARSTGVGKGSEFGFWVPVTRKVENEIKTSK